MRKNLRVRLEMEKAGINQSKLGEILGKDAPTVSKLLNEIEWKKSEQDEVIKKIRECASAQ